MIRLFPFLLMTGCVSAPIQIPQRDCKRIVLPPIPQKVFLQIEGDKIISDDGGSLLLRGYVAARDAK